MVNEKVFTTVVWSDETVTFFCVEPFNYTVAHTIILYIVISNPEEISVFAFPYTHQFYFGE